MPRKRMLSYVTGEIEESLLLRDRFFRRKALRNRARRLCIHLLETTVRSHTEADIAHGDAFDLSPQFFRYEGGRISWKRWK